MPSPFPGMDPYLEDPAVWPSFHATFIPQIAAELNRHIRPKYVAIVERRIYITNRYDAEAEPRLPDVAVYRRQPFDNPKSARGTALIEAPIKLDIRIPSRMKQLFVVIKDVKTKNPVTVIELISPSNKVAGSGGRRSYLHKKKRILQSETHWMEIDLLRGGKPTFDRPQTVTVPDYAVFCSRAERRNPGLIWPFNLERMMPVIGVPLSGRDGDAALPLQTCLTETYDNGGFDGFIDYRESPEPPFSSNTATWAYKPLKAAKLR